MLLLPVACFGNRKLPSFDAFLEAARTGLADLAPLSSTPLIFANSRASAFGHCPEGRLKFSKRPGFGIRRISTVRGPVSAGAGDIALTTGIVKLEATAELSANVPSNNRYGAWRPAHLQESRKCLSCKRQLSRNDFKRL